MTNFAQTTNKTWSRTEETLLQHRSLKKFLVLC